MSERERVSWLSLSLRSRRAIVHGAWRTTVARGISRWLCVQERESQPDRKPARREVIVADGVNQVMPVPSEAVDGYGTSVVGARTRRGLEMVWPISHRLRLLRVPAQLT